VELMRSDPATEIAGIRINSFTSAIVFVLAVAYVVVARKGREAPEELKSRRPGGADEAAAAGGATGTDDAHRDGVSGSVVPAEPGGKVESGTRSENEGDKS
ncbi:prolipoprotein diacylglyceryl transferase, partial [Rhodococcus ruber]